jgi:hypothetical protein
VSDRLSRARRERLPGSAISNIRHSKMASYKQHTCNSYSQLRHLRPNLCDLHSIPNTVFFKVFVVFLSPCVNQHMYTDIHTYKRTHTHKHLSRNSHLNHRTNNKF